MLNDVRFAVRVLRRSPAFTALAVLTLALGIGATVTMFSVADAVLIRPVAYPDPSRLVQIWGQNPARNIPFHAVPYPDVVDWRQEARSFESLAAVAGSSASLAGRGDPEVVRLARVNAELLPMLGVTAAAGRLFQPSEDRPGAERVVVISHEIWQRRFGGDASVLGQAVTLDGAPATIVGVLPASFSMPGNPADVLTPLADAGLRNREDAPPRTVMVFARLRPDVSLERAQAEMTRVSRSLDQRVPGPPQGRNIRVWSLTDFRTRTVRVSLLVLVGAVAMVLLIACVNVANLRLARASLRRSEVAVRLALGASRRRLVGQFLTESGVVAAAAGVVGLVLAYWGVKGVVTLAGTRVPSLPLAGIDLRVLVVALATTAFTIVLFGLGPALAISRSSGGAGLQGALRESGRRQGGRLGGRLRQALVAAEVALSLVLLVGAALLLQSFARLQAVEPGFDPRGVMTATVALSADRYRGPAEIDAFFRRFVADIQRDPGVVAAGITSSLPLSGHNQGTYLVGESGAVIRREDAPVVWYRSVSAGYFRAMGIPLLRGRLFDAVEERNRGTVLVNREMAERYWPGEDPIGRRLRGAASDPRAAGPWLTVVGVVGGVHHMALSTPAEPEIYFSFASLPSRAVAVAVRTRREPEASGPVLAGAAKGIDREQAVSSVSTLESAMYRSTASERLSTTVLGLFAVLACALSVVGLCGVTSYLVDQRTHEIGVRMALGARRGDVLRLVLRDGMRAAAIGVAVGLVGATAAARVVQSMLFGVSVWNPLAFGAGAAILLFGAIAGIYFPARRASAIDPLVALREQ